MKKFGFLILTLVFAAVAQAQNPVTWTFTSKKISNDQYEVHLTANIQSGWHLYAQDQPKGAIAMPTSITFNKSPLLNFEGKVKEVGKLEKFTDEVLDATAHQYSNKVDFVQKVKLKGKAKTAVTGSLVFQTCDDHKCLPPKTVSFTIALK
jgi:thiol:disulfide interchange protein DsbD